MVLSVERFNAHFHSSHLNVFRVLYLLLKLINVHKAMRHKSQVNIPELSFGSVFPADLERGELALAKSWSSCLHHGEVSRAYRRQEKHPPPIIYKCFF